MNILQAEQHKLICRFEELGIKFNQCKSILQNGASYTTLAQTYEWSSNMRTYAKELNNLFSDTLRYLSTKMI